MVSPLASIVANARPQTNAGFGQYLQGLRQGNEQIAGMQQNRELQAEQAGMNRDQVQRQEQMAKLQFVNRLGKKLLSTDQMQWGQLLQPQLPILQQMGYDVSMIDQLNPETVEAIVAQTDAVLGGQDAAMTAGQRDMESMVDALTGAINPDTGKPFTREQARRAIALRQSGVVARAGTTTSEERIARDEGLTEDVARSKEKIAQRRKFGEATGASRAKKIDQGFDKIQAIDKNINNINNAITAIDEGANTGRIEKTFFPSIKAATVKLDQIQNELALDVIGGVTFGALSEGELKLAQETALPTGLQEAELKQYLIDKREAQNKLRAYFEEQIDFLDQGGTIAGFLRSKRRGSTQGATVSKPQNQQETMQGSGVVDWSQL